MKWVADIIHPKPLHFVIEQTEFQNLSHNTKSVKYYLYVYDNGHNTHDYLQDTLEIAKDQALEDFGVPKASWKQIDH